MMRARRRTIAAIAATALLALALPLAAPVAVAQARSTAPGTVPPTRGARRRRC